MPYPPIPNPKYLHWEPWPHLYRRGMPAATVTAFHRRSLGETSSAPPWQCWDMPGFKDCQQSCFDKVQKTGVSAAAQGALVDQCFSLECVEPCKKTLGAQAAAPDSAKKGLLDGISSSSPMTLAVIAVVIAVGATLLAPGGKGNRR